jgi:hypothetical protein
LTPDRQVDSVADSYPIQLCGEFRDRTHLLAIHMRYDVAESLALSVYADQTRGRSASSFEDVDNDNPLYTRARCRFLGSRSDAYAGSGRFASGDKLRNDPVYDVHGYGEPNSRGGARAGDYGSVDADQPPR